METQAIPAAEENPEGQQMLMESAEMSPEEQEAQVRAQRLAAFGQSLARTRSKAIAARQQSGIEEIWREDQDFYEGVDDLSRGDERSVRTEKPPTTSAGTSRFGKSGARGNISRVFPNITAPFVEAAAAHMSDILLPTEDRPWSLEPTPIPEMEAKADQYKAENPEAVKAAEKKSALPEKNSPMPNMQRAESEARDDQLEDQDPGVSDEEAFEQTMIAKALAEASETRIWDWHVEGDFNAKNRECVEDSARLGTGILKGPIPKAEMNVGWIPEHLTGDLDEFGDQVVEGSEIKISTDTKPISKRIDCWNFYPAAGCGQSIQSGDYCWERDYVTRRQLISLKRDQTYLHDQIDKCLKEGPTRAIAEIPETNSLTINSQVEDKYEIWYGYCMAEREDLAAADVQTEDLPNEAHIDTFVVLVNNRCIKASLPVTEYCGFPYDVFNWRKRANYWAGIGVSRQVRTAQKIVVGATRSMMNNAGLAGGPMIVFKQGVVRPADGVAGLGPRKVFYIQKDDQTIDDARKAIGQIKVDIMVDEMMKIVQLGLSQAENNSGFPMLMQGQMGGAPDRVGVINVLDKNTNAIKRRLARNYTDDLMAPHLKRYYVYHLMYGPDNEKGDLQVNVKGYAALVERDIQNQELGQMYSLVLDPRFKLDPSKWVKEYLKSRHLPYSDMEIEDEQWGQMLENFQAFQEFSEGGSEALQIASMKEEGQNQRAQLNAEVQGAMKLNDNQYKGMKDEMDRRLMLLLKAADSELEEMRLAGADRQSVMRSKNDLAKKVMEIQSTWKLAQMQAPANALPEPPIEPPGRAPDGQSFTK